MAVKPTRTFSHATQRKAGKCLGILKAIRLKDSTLQELQLLYGGSPSGIRGVLYDFMEAGLVIDVDPQPRKSLYSITKDSKLVQAKIKELEDILAVELLPMHYTVRTPKSKTKIISVEEKPPLVFRHSELHMRLFPKVYKNFISS